MNRPRFLVLPVLVCATLLAQPPQETKVPQPLPFVDVNDKSASPAPAPTPILEAPRPSIQQPAAPLREPAPEHRPTLSGFSAAKLAGRVFYDEPGDGSLWAAGETFKASFDNGTFTYVPFFGSDAPQNYPVTLALEAVTLGGEPQPLAAERSRAGATISFHRGALIESYRVTPKGIEQTFTLASLSGRGELVVRIRTTSELAFATDDRGLRFGNELGHVGYTRAIAIDADGNRVDVETAFADGAITLRVPAAFVAAGRLPITIDPVITTFTVRPPTETWKDPDIVWQDVDLGMCATYERVYSATDSDIVAELFSRNGVPVAGSQGYVDVTGVSWQLPRIAYKRIGGRFLVVAERGPNAGPRAIHGRTRDTTVGGNMGPQFQISGTNEAGDKRAPVVGGDPHVTGPTFFCVVWERVYSTTDHDIHYRMVNADSTLYGNTLFLENSSARSDVNPRISRSNGSVSASLQNWNVVWNYKFPSNPPYDVYPPYAARIRWDGTVSTSAFLITYGVSALEPTIRGVSTITESSAGGNYWFVVLSEFFGSRAVLYDGATRVTSWNELTIDLSALTGKQSSEADIPHDVDSDGCRFAYLYRRGDFPQLHSTKIATLHVSGVGLAVSEPSVTLSTGNIGFARLASAWGSNWPQNGVPRGRMLYASTEAVGGTVLGTVYEGRRPTGGFRTVPIACGGRTITHSAGAPGLGAPLSISMTNPIGPSAILVGPPSSGRPILLCTESPCQIGIDFQGLFVMLTSSFNTVIPCTGGLLGQTIAFQGLDFGPGGCAIGYRLSDRVDVTIQ